MNINNKVYVNFNNLKTHHKFSIADNENSESWENDAIPTNCDYYDSDQFQILIKTFPKNFFSLLHTNIRSLRANHENLMSLLTTHGLNFDIISLTETWDANSNSNNFVPNMLDFFDFLLFPFSSFSSSFFFFLNPGGDVLRQKVSVAICGGIFELKNDNFSPCWMDINIIRVCPAFQKKRVDVGFT